MGTAAPITAGDLSRQESESVPSPRESEILHFLAAGATSREISVPQTSANAQVSAGAQSNTTASAPSANVVSSTTGQLGINLGR